MRSTSASRSCCLAAREWSNAIRSSLRGDRRPGGGADTRGGVAGVSAAADGRGAVERLRGGAVAGTARIVDVLGAEWLGRSRRPDGGEGAHVFRDAADALGVEVMSEPMEQQLRPTDGLDFPAVRAIREHVAYAPYVLGVTDGGEGTHVFRWREGGRWTLVERP